MTTSVFPLSTVISVSILSAPALPAVPQINSLAIITQDATPATWASGQVFATYSTSDAVGVDFGVNSNTYAQALAAFSQQPNFLLTQGYLVVIPRLQSPSLESVVACLERTVNLVYYQAFVIDQELTTSAPTTFSQIAAYAQANGILFFYTSSNPNDLNPGSSLDLLRQAADVNVRYSYYASPLLNGAGSQQTQIFAAAYAARELSVDFDGSQTVITMDLKQLATISADGTLTQTQLTAAKTVGADVYANISGFPCIISSGANNWTDQIYNQMWLQMALQNAGFDLLAATSKKLPMTEAGMQSLKGVLGNVMAQGVNNGFLTRGVWPVGASVFGNTKRLVSNIAQFGYYIFSSPIAGQTQAQLQSRTAPLIQIAALSAGAIHNVAVIVNLAL